MIATDKLALKEKVFAAIDAAYDELFDYAKSVAKEPEFGFKEFKTAKKVEAQFDKLGIPYRNHLAITGVKGLLKGGKPGPTIAILGELDAISSPDHPLADPDTGAAHACGHHMQQSAMLAAAYGLARTHALDELCGNVVFFAVPAEEYVQLAYRKKLRREGKLHYLHGKGQLIYEGEFDDIDMAMQMHSSKKTPEPTVAVGTSSNGFVGKTIQYVGRSAHAADAPDQGINALNAAMLGIMGINSLRETFRDEDAIRVHPIITKGGDLVNNVPDDVRIETYVRAKTMEAIEKTHKESMPPCGLAVWLLVPKSTSTRCLVICPLSATPHLMNFWWKMPRKRSPVSRSSMPAISVLPQIWETFLILCPLSILLLGNGRAPSRRRFQGCRL
ncbi:peptidase dimerization domain-containing protein [Acidaminococcus intestini]|nr:peptidase dimerization domain-containing protein [Acidaminococcus intestini]